MSPDWSKDPQGVPYANFENPQSLNLYAFVQNNPVTATDPDGHWCLFGMMGSTCGSKDGTSYDHEGKADQTSRDPKPSLAAVGSLHSTMDAVNSAIGDAVQRAWHNFAHGCEDVTICDSVSPFMPPEGELADVAEGVRMTQWGWEGGAGWRAAVKAVSKGGTIEEIGGKVPTEAEARGLLAKAGASID